MISSTRADIVGRNTELTQLLAAMGDPAVGLVVVDGVAGIGKSTLLETLATQAVRRRWNVERARGLNAGRAYPLAPFLHLLDPAEPSDRAVDDLQRLLGRLGRRADGERAVLIVDDLHLLDDGSLVLLHRLAWLGTTTVVGSVRGLEGAHEDLAMLATSERGRVLTLGPLERAASDELVGSVVADPPAELCRQVWCRAQGSPLFTRELVRGSVECGSLVRRPDGWQLVGALAPSGRLVDVLRHRLDRCTPGSRVILRALALAGSLPSCVVRQLVGAGEVDHLERAGLVQWSAAAVVPPGAPMAIGQLAPDHDRVGRSVPSAAPQHSGAMESPRLALAHDLYGSVLRDDLSPAARRDVLDRLVVAVRTAGAHGPDELMLLANLLLDLGEPDAPTLLAAAELALRRYDDDDALRLVDAALDAGGGFDAELLRASALGRSGRVREAAELFEDLERRVLEPERRALVAYRHASYLLQECAAPDRAAAVLDRGIAELPSELAAPLVGYLSSLHFYTGRPLAAIRVAEPLVQGERIPPEALPGLMSSWAVLGRPSEVLAMSGRTWTAPSPRLDTNLVLNLVWNRMLALWQVGALAGLDDPLQGLPRPRVEIFDATWTSEAMRATLAALRGHLDESVRRYVPLQERLCSTMVQVGVFNLSLLVGVQSMRGDLLAARQVLDLVEGFPRSASLGFRWWLDRAMLAWRAGLGDVDTAARASIELARHAEGQDFHVTTSLYDAVRYGAAHRVVEALGVQAERPGATWWDLQCHRHAVAVAAHDVPALLAVAEVLEAGGLDLYSLEAFTVAAELAAAGPPSARQDAARAVVGAARVGARCGRVATPVMVAKPAGITARELTVARMAAAGMSNGEIGAQLGTSVRTVGNQLQRVFDRLGVHSRHALGEVLGPVR